MSRFGNVVFQEMVRYMIGGMAFSFEFNHWHTRVAMPQNALTANQYMLSAFYFF